MFIVFDIGGTHTRIAVSADGENLDKVQKFSTPQDFEAGIKMFAEYKKSLQVEVKAVAGGVAGPLDKSKSTLVGGRNMKGWQQKSLKGELEKVFECPVVLGNDADMAGLGETCMGAGKGYDIVGYITVGTGLGGARFTNGRLDNSEYGFEPGRQKIIVSDGLVDVEEYFSGLIIEKDYGLKASEINDDKFWDKQARRLAIILNNATVMWSPQVIVLGGGVILNSNISLEKVKSFLKEMLIYDQAPDIKKAKLGDEAGLYGALSVLQ